MVQVYALLPPVRVLVVVLYVMLLQAFNLSILCEVLLMMLSQLSCNLCLKKFATLVYNSDMHELLLIIFGRSVTEKVRNPKVLYFPTSPI